ncbi:Crp/Fnr family transcriptional regulator [Chitinophaga rhizosphaerae]|uniref:Crp/Fnr family transcriptional regulator n=1 Tax=Chitinophaga rhizosphaerae TaxID=1864947 RepID=UPI000F80FB25|nr:Crp/Fnr family transcriptional regulator [Chitinophaga rhizosphaerae]
MKTAKQACNMDTCLLCKLCLPAWKPAVATHRKNFTLKKGEMLFSEGDPVNGIYFINEGGMKVHKQWGREKELIVRFAGAGDIVGHRGIGTDLVYPVSATALETSTVCYFDLDFFQSTLQVNTPLLYELMMFYARELQESEKRMRNLAHMPVKGRIAAALLHLEKKFGTENGHIDFPLTRQDIASYTGTTYETAWRMLQELAKEGMISLEVKRYAVLDQEAVRTYILSQEAGEIP